VKKRILCALLCTSSLFCMTSCTDFLNDSSDSSSESKYNFEVPTLFEEDSIITDRYFISDETEDYTEFVIVGETNTNKLVSYIKDETYLKKSSGYTTTDFSNLTLQDYIPDVNWDLLPNVQYTVTENYNYIVVKIELNNLKEHAKAAMDSGFFIPTDNNPINEGDSLDSATLCASLGYKEIDYAEYLSKSK